MLRGIDLASAVEATEFTRTLKSASPDLTAAIERGLAFVVDERVGARAKTRAIAFGRSRENEARLGRMRERGARQLSRQTLAEVIEPRIEELYSLVQRELRSSGYEELLSSGIVLTGGSSALQGEGSLDLRSTTPVMKINLRAPRLQLDDVRLSGWSPTKAQTTSSYNAQDQKTLRKKASEASQQVQGLLSPQTLRAVDAAVTVNVERVLSGMDVLGGGRLEVRLANGRAIIGGGRYDRLMTTLGASAEIPAIGAAIWCDRLLDAGGK